MESIKGGAAHLQLRHGAPWNLSAGNSGQPFFRRALAALLAIATLPLVDAFPALAFPLLSPRSRLFAAERLEGVLGVRSMSLGEWVIASKTWTAVTLLTTGFFFFSMSKAYMTA